MSGTGNSFRAATWAGKDVTDKGAQSQVIPIERANPTEEVSGGPDNIMGIVTPTHGFTAPWHMLRFISRLPRQKGTHAFCVTTQAGAKLGPVFIPGLSCTAPFLIALILAIKGFNVRGVLCLDMPSNWMALHSGFPPRSVAAIIARARPKVGRFMDRLLSGESYWLTGSNVYEFIMGILLLPISFLFLILGRFFLAKLFFASNQCTGCGSCSLHCPVGAVVMRGDKDQRPYWRYNCESCMRCMAYCPEKAIEAGHSWAILLNYITSVPVSIYLFNWLSATFPAAAVTDKAWLQEVVQLLYVYPSLFLSYYIFSLLIHNSIINKLFTYTTLTHIYRRYHEPDARLEDFAVKRKKQS